MAKERLAKYKRGMPPCDLAYSVLKNYYGDSSPSIPIDPFKLMKEYGIVYQFMGFKDLEGIYLVPEDEDDIGIVGINNNRPITRQRFTAAHELCHHIKDRINETCKIGSRDSREKYAEQFAAELLMPFKLFRLVAEEYAVDGKVSLDSALLISDRFGVSFKSCVNRLYFGLHMIDDTYSELSKKIKKYKPDKIKETLGIDMEPVELLCQAVNSYEFIRILLSDRAQYNMV